MLLPERMKRIVARVLRTEEPKPASPVEIYMGQARLGMALEAARETELYRYLVTRALAEHETAVENLLQADPTNTGLVLTLQGEAKRLDALTRWLDDAISAGHAAYMRLQEETYDDA